MTMINDDADDDDDGDNDESMTKIGMTTTITIVSVTKLFPGVPFFALDFVLVPFSSLVPFPLEAAFPLLPLILSAEKYFFSTVTNISDAQSKQNP